MLRLLMQGLPERDPWRTRLGAFWVLRLLELISKGRQWRPRQWLILAQLGLNSSRALGGFGLGTPVGFEFGMGSENLVLLRSM